MITKIEPKNVCDLNFDDCKEELIMRLHDAALRYQQDRAVEAWHKFEYFESLAKVDAFSSLDSISDLWLVDLAKSQPENVLRMRDLISACIRGLEIDEDYAEESSALVAPEQIELIEVECVDEFGRTEKDIDRLRQLEFAIEKSLKSVGDALLEIRDSGLYKEFRTFEAYCEERWGFSRSRAYQLIGATKVVHNLLTSGINPDALPVNEAQTRALSAVPPERQAEVWSEANRDGKASAAKVRAVAAKEIPPTPPCKGGQEEGEWNPNLWETPDHIARAIADLLIEGLAILEPCAGTGQIAKAIASKFEGAEYEITAIEILKERAEKLEDNRYFSIDADFLEFDFGSETFDAVVTNPPFDKGLEILERSLQLLNISGRCLFLLPIAYFQSQERAKKFAGMNAYIHRVYPVVGRIAYLKNGIPENGRQCEDAIFDIRTGKLKGQVEFIWQ